MAYMNKKVAVVHKLPQLQNLIKRDPKAYHEEFLMQKNHFESELEIFKMKPTKDSDRFTELVNFICHVSACYKDETAHVPGALMSLLEEHSANLHPDVRAKLIQSLILLRNKEILDPLPLLRLAFKLFTVQDKTMRVMLCEYIVNDIKAININKHNNQLNRNIQALLYTVVSGEADSTAARKTTQILAELYRRRIWTDARTVNVLASACTSPHVAVMLSAINFFLGIETKMHEDEDEEKAKVNTSEVNYHEHSKKTRKRQRQVQRAITHNEKVRRKENVKSETIVPLFPAIQLIHDPQVLVEKLFKRLKSSNEHFDVKLTVMNFISRLIGCHKLIHLAFYSFLNKYLTAHQKDVTKILAYLIQGCHDLVPPDELLPVVKSIAHHFITERCTTEVVAIGINSVREVLVRVPALLKEPGMEDFIQDLVLYGKKTHKSVMIAAHSVQNLVRYGITIPIMFL
jgi:protein SDA1